MTDGIAVIPDGASEFFLITMVLDEAWPPPLGGRSPPRDFDAVCPVPFDTFNYISLSRMHSGKTRFERGVMIMASVLDGGVTRDEKQFRGRWGTASPRIAAPLEVCDGETPGATHSRVVERIIAAATQEVADCGLDGLSMEDVAVRANCSRATVYRRIGGKEALRDAVLVEAITRINAAVAEIVSRCEDDDRVFHAIRASLDTIRADPVSSALLTGPMVGQSVSSALITKVTDSVALLTNIGVDDGAGRELIARVTLSLLCWPAADRAAELAIIRRYAAAHRSDGGPPPGLTAVSLKAGPGPGSRPVRKTERTTTNADPQHWSALVMTEEPELLVEQRDRILVITINRPKSRNAINGTVSQGLADAMDRLDGDPGLSVGVLTGAGGTFSAGMDLKAFARGEAVAVEGRGLGFTERPPAKPLIAAVEGFALAGGTELALATDLIVASRDAMFGIPEVKRGLVAGGGGLLRLPGRIPYSIAMELALTGENLPAERANELGLVNVLAEPGSALEAAIALAERITANGPLAVAATKRIIVESRSWAPEAMFAEQTKILLPVFSSSDAKEGAVAFAEKRPPRWTGS